MDTLFKTRWPIIQAPMASFQDHALTIAVCNAGGLGSLPCAALSESELIDSLEAIKAGTDQPFNLNFFCHRQRPVTEAQLLAWQKILQPYYQAFNLEQESVSTQPTRMPFSERLATLVAPYKPPVVSFHFGLPDKELVDYIKGWGATILSSATTLDEAIWLEQNGADAVIAQGIEAGGHRGHFLTRDITQQSSTKQLVERLVNELKIPVIAAGGIAVADDVVDMLRLGAQAVQVGTSYLLCHEAKTTAVHREAIRRKGGGKTVVTNLFSGGEARGIANRLIDDLGAVHPEAPAFPFAGSALAPLRKMAERAGSDDFSPLWAGTNTLGCKEVSAAELTQSLISDRGER